MLDPDCGNSSCSMHDPGCGDISSSFCSTHDPGFGVTSSEVDFSQLDPSCGDASLDSPWNDPNLSKYYATK